MSEQDHTQNESKPHFDISAFVVRQLGDELISDEVTALLELVKNSYDADASYVNIVIDTEGKLTEYDVHYKDHKGYILIADDGDGMTKSEIENGWLTISVSKKRSMKADNKATEKGRTPLGEKGLGRLSTQRLASKMELISHNEKSEEPAYHVYFNWNDFTEETLLSEVNVEIIPLEKSSIKKGTRLILLDIKDRAVWEGNSIERIKGKLSQLVFPLKRKRTFSIYLTVNGNAVDLDYVSENVKELAISRYSFSFYNDRLSILGRIKLPKLRGNDRANYVHLIESDKGKGFYDFLTSNLSSKKYALPPHFKYNGNNGVFVDFKRSITLDDIPGKLVSKHPSEEKEEFVDPGNFRGKIDEYNFVKDAIDISPIEEIFKEFTKYTNYIQSQVGIRLFRDGFGIRPFGLDGEDWLKLSQEQTSGASFYGLRPGNVIGYIQIGAQSNPNLHEKTDREGIIDNAFYKNFYLLNKKVIAEVNVVLEIIKRAYNEYRKKYGIDTTGLKSQSEVFALMKKTGEGAKQLIDQVKALDTEIAKVYNAVRNEIRLAKSSGLGDDEDRRLQDLLKSIEQQLAHSQSIIAKLNNILEDASKLNEAVHLIEPQMQTLQDQLAEFSELAGLGMIAESLSHEIDNILDNLAQKSKTMSKHIRDKKYVDPNLYGFIDYVNNVTQSLRKQASHLSPVLKYVREGKDQLSLGIFANELAEFYKERLEQTKISIGVEAEEDFTVTINKGKLTQIFDNLILNSEYWLKEHLHSRAISPRITIRIKRPMMQVFDNGLGIDPTIEDKVFQPFVTSKPKKSGRGLGLFIVQQLLETTGCDIALLPDKNEGGRRYIFQINFTNILK